MGKITDAVCAGHKTTEKTVPAADWQGKARIKQILMVAPEMGPPERWCFLKEIDLETIKVLANKHGVQEGALKNLFELALKRNYTMRECGNMLEMIFSSIHGDPALFSKKEIEELKALSKETDFLEMLDVLMPETGTVYLFPDSK